MTQDIFALYATDAKLEEEGAWINAQGGKKGEDQFLIARDNNRAYSRMLAEAVEDNQALLALKDKAADNASDEILADVMAATILLGWKGNHVYKGSALGDYTKAKAKELLLHKEFRKWVAKQAGELDHFRAKFEAEQGNV